jgi:signal transduction histidine kinase
MTPEGSSPQSKIGDVHARWRISSDLYASASRSIYVGYVSIIVAVSYFAASEIGFAFTPPHQATSAFWPPNAVLLAALLLVPRRLWWTVILAVLPAHFLIQLAFGAPAWTALGWFVGNMSEALIGALCISHFKKQATLFESIRGVFVFLIFGVFLAPLLSSFLDAGAVLSTGLGKSYWIVWGPRLFSNMLAELTIVPTVVLLFTRGRMWLRESNMARQFEAAILVTALVSTGVLAFTAETGWRADTQALAFAPVPLFIWASLRFGAWGLSASLLGTSMFSIWNAIHGRDPFIGASPAQNVMTLQILFCCVGSPLLLLSAYIAELRQINYKLIGAQEQERRRIARELHDDVCQQLTLLQIDLDEVRHAAEPVLACRLSKLYKQLSEAVETTHEISHGLHPAFLERKGLAPSLEALCRQFGTEKTPQIRFIHGSSPLNCPAEVLLCLYRVAQESVQNAARHSHARNAQIELRTEGKRLYLRISDDGVGFDLQEGMRSGLGLVSMRERIKAVGGTIRFSSTRETGTCIEASVSLIGSPVHGTTPAQSDV